jgi:hypothetical protein
MQVLEVDQVDVRELPNIGVDVPGHSQIDQPQGVIPREVGGAESSVAELGGRDGRIGAGQLFPQAIHPRRARAAHSKPAGLGGVPVKYHRHSSPGREAFGYLAAHRAGTDHQDSGVGTVHQRQQPMGRDGRDRPVKGNGWRDRVGRFRGPPEQIPEDGPRVAAQDSVTRRSNLVPDFSLPLGQGLATRRDPEQVSDCRPPFSQPPGVPRARQDSPPALNLLCRPYEEGQLDAVTGGEQRDLLCPFDSREPFLDAFPSDRSGQSLERIEAGRVETTLQSEEPEGRDVRAGSAFRSGTDRGFRSGSKMG